MKFNKKSDLKPDIEIVAIPRRDGAMIFKAAAVTEFDDFLKLCPMPIPPSIMRKGGVQGQNIEDPTYKAELDAWATRRTDWMIIKSLQATEALEWDTVKMEDCMTWTNFRTEFLASGLTPIEINTIIQAVVDACGLNQKKIDQATASFLAGQAALSAAL